ncbi:MAG: hypothetical protein Q9M28_04475 [Mariprofundaceae bacterium]|nr:hypothetical protein [Mariprofundaceae bacterium]
MRLFFMTLLFFVGPMVLIFAVRNGFLLWRAWLKLRCEHPEPKILDVTPIDKSSNYFVILSICVSLAIFAYAWVQMSDDHDVGHVASTPEKIYVPSYIDDDGHVVKGYYAEPEDIKEVK